VLREYATETSAAYVALPEHTSFARFLGDLVHALSTHVPGMRLSLAGAYERALQRSDPAETLSSWFVRHVEDVACTIVLDDFHNAAEPLIARFVARSIERSAENCRWIVSSRSLDELPVASWLAHGSASLPIDEADLRLSLDEAEMIAQQLMPEIPSGAVARLHASTNGIVADFVFLLRRPEEDGFPERRLDVAFETAAEQVYDSLEPLEREFVLQTALLPSLVSATVAKSAGAEAGAMLSAVREKAPQIFDDGGARYQSHFRAFLRAKLDGLDSIERERMVARAARALESAGDVAGALHLFAEVEDESEILRLIDRYGFASLESDKSYFLHDALAALSEESRGANHAVLAVRAMMASLGGRLDVSEALFQHALSSCTAPQQHMRMRYLYACDLMRRGRSDAITLLKPDTAFFEAPAEVRVAVMSALGAAYVMEERMDLARKWVERALSAAERLHDSVLSARVHHQASFVALYSGDGQGAKRLATTAAALAEQQGVFEVAGGAYSVLYNVAADLEDDPQAAASFLERIAACGAKCGSVEKQLFAWVAAYEIAIERGDGRAAAGIERELTEFDVQYSARPAMQSLLPARAQQLAWYGDFERAFRLLDSSAPQQATADRQALRWSEIAIYAAGAGLKAEATHAATMAWRMTKRDADGNSLRLWRTRAYCALAFVLLGRVTAPRIILDGLRNELPPERERLWALVNAVEALALRRAGERNHETLACALDELRRRHYGGVARLLEALPSERVTPVRVAAARPARLHAVPNERTVSIPSTRLPIAESA